MKPKGFTVRPVFIFLGLLLVVGVLYWPGLQGIFLLDDESNLAELNALGRGFNLDEWLRFIFFGRSGPLGRPLSLLTFALQHESWALFLFDFKAVNIAIHLTNGLLIYFLLMKTGELAQWPQERRWRVSILAAFLWLVHPLQVSTVLYIVQRMTLLSATFVFGGILVYLHGRSRLHQAWLAGSWSGAGLGWCFAGMGLGGVLAVLSKENGVLLPVFVLVLEGTLLKKFPWPRRYWVWRGVLLYLPMVLLVGYFLVKWKALLASYGSREFTLSERLWTQLRVVSEYLHQIALPRLQGFGIFHDDFSISRGWTDPITTLWSAFFLLGLLFAALAFRSRVPWFSFAILWFFAGHLLESTFLPLELYFEHRNYISVLGFVFFVAWGVIVLFEGVENRIFKGLVAGLALFMAGMFCVMTYEESWVWGHPRLQATIWARENPDSSRAQYQLANVFYRGGMVEETIGVVEQYKNRHPMDLSSYLTEIKIGCERPDSFRLEDFTFIEQVHGMTEGSVALSIGLLEHLVVMREKRLEACSVISLEQLLEICQELLKNPAFGSPTTKNSLHLLSGRLYALMHQLDPAMEQYDLAQTYEPRLETLLMQVQWLGSAGLVEDAERYLAKARAMRDSNWIRNRLNQKKLEPYGPLMERYRERERLRKAKSEEMKP